MSAARNDWKAEELVPGAHVEWRQFTAEGDAGLRSGTVWDRAPDVDGARAVAWVIPYAPRPYDPYGLIAVGIVSRAHLPVNGNSFDVGAPRANKGELVSSCVPSSPLGNLGTVAAQQARKVRGAR
jgi:hypothetical protein